MGKGAAVLIGIGYTYWVFYLMMWGFAAAVGGIVIGVIAVIFMLCCWINAMYKARYRYRNGTQLFAVAICPFTAALLGYMYNLVAKNWVQHTVINWWPEQGSWWDLICGIVFICGMAYLLFLTVAAPYFLGDNDPVMRLQALIVIHFDVIFAVTVHMLATAPHPSG
jgi:hypothetical protein